MPNDGNIVVAGPCDSTGKAVLALVLSETVTPTVKVPDTDVLAGPDGNNPNGLWALVDGPVIENVFMREETEKLLPLCPALLIVVDGERKQL